MWRVLETLWKLSTLPGFFQPGPECIAIFHHFSPPHMCTAARLGIGQVTCVKECWEIDANRSRKQKAAFGLGADAFGALQAGSETTPRAASVCRRIYQCTTQMPECSNLGQHPSSTMLPTALLPPPSAPRSPPPAHLMQRKRLFCRRCCSTEICCCAV